MAKITFADKAPSVINPINKLAKISAEDMNEIKVSVNALYDISPDRVFTVATLPVPASGVAYATVSDATAPTYLGALTGGGAVVCPVFYNGTSWVSH